MPKRGVGQSKLSAENLEKYGAAFDAIDADGKGSIDKSELSAILGEDVTPEAVSACWAKFDTDHDGEMDKDEFFDFVYGARLEQARAFLKAADQSGDGKLSPDELKAVFEQMGIPEDQAQVAVDNCDDDGSGTISIDEIVDFLLEVEG